MLTRTRFLEYCETPILPTATYNKGDCITLSNKLWIVMAKLSADHNSPITYNICNEELLHPQFGVSLETAELIPTLVLSERIRNRAKNFV